MTLPSPDGCPFCSPSPPEIFYEDELVRGIWNAYPVTEGHALLVTRRHVVDWFDASPAEQTALALAVEQARRAILEHHQPNGFNVGLNCGTAAGQTVFHVHMHVVPRYPEPLHPTGELAGLIPHGHKPHRYKPHLVPGAQLIGELTEAIASVRRVELTGRVPDGLAPALQALSERGGRWRCLDALPPGMCRLQDADGREHGFVGVGAAYRLIDGQDARGLVELREVFESVPWSTE